MKLSLHSWISTTLLRWGMFAGIMAGLLLLTIPGGVGKMRRCGAEEGGFVVDLAVSGLWLDQVILKVFSNLHDSMTLLRRLFVNQTKDHGCF